MKQIITLSLIAFSLGIFSPAQAQEKEEVLELIEAVLDLDDVQPLYQHEFSQGPTLVFLKPERRSLGRNREDLMRNLLFELRTDDFSFFNNPVQVMTENEARALDIPLHHLADISIFMNETEAKIFLNCFLWQTRERYAGQFSFVRETEEDDWELNSKNSDIRSSR